MSDCQFWVMQLWSFGISGMRMMDSKNFLLLLNSGTGIWLVLYLDIFFFLETFLSLFLNYFLKYYWWEISTKNTSGVVSFCLKIQHKEKHFHRLYNWNVSFSKTGSIGRNVYFCTDYIPVPSSCIASIFFSDHYDCP